MSNFWIVPLFHSVSDMSRLFHPASYTTRGNWPPRYPYTFIRTPTQHFQRICVLYSSCERKIKEAIESMNRSILCCCKCRTERQSIKMENRKRNRKKMVK